MGMSQFKLVTVGEGMACKKMEAIVCANNYPEKCNSERVRGKYHVGGVAVFL